MLWCVNQDAKVLLKSPLGVCCRFLVSALSSFFGPQRFGGLSNENSNKKMEAKKKKMCKVAVVGDSGGCVVVAAAVACVNVCVRVRVRVCVCADTLNAIADFRLD